MKKKINMSSFKIDWPDIINIILTILLPTLLQLTDNTIISYISFILYLILIIIMSYIKIKHGKRDLETELEKVKNELNKSNIELNELKHILFSKRDSALTEEKMFQIIRIGFADSHGIQSIWYSKWMDYLCNNQQKSIDENYKKFKKINETFNSSYIDQKLEEDNV